MAVMWLEPIFVKFRTVKTKMPNKTKPKKREQIILQTQIMNKHMEGLPLVLIISLLMLVNRSTVFQMRENTIATGGTLVG